MIYCDPPHIHLHYMLTSSLHISWQHVGCTWPWVWYFFVGRVDRDSDVASGLRLHFRVVLTHQVTWQCVWDFFVGIVMAILLQPVGRACISTHQPALWYVKKARYEMWNCASIRPSGFAVLDHVSGGDCPSRWLRKEKRCGYIYVLVGCSSWCFLFRGSRLG